MSVHFPFALSLFAVLMVRGGRVLLALYALQLDAEPFTVGVLAATFSVLPALLAYQIGRLSDHYGARWPLLLGIGGGGLGIIVPFFFNSIPALFVAAILNGLAFAFYNVSLQTVIGQLSAPHERTRNFNNFTLVVSTGNLIAPLLVGFSIDYYGHANTSAIRAIGCSISGLECQNQCNQPQGYGSILHPPCAPFFGHRQGDAIPTWNQGIGYRYGRWISWHPASNLISRYPLPFGRFHR